MADARARTALRRGLALRDRRRLKEAIAEFERATSIDPGLADAWFWLAATRDNRGEELEAVPAYRRALELGLQAPGREAQAWTWLASSLSKTGAPQEAASALERAERLGGYEPLDEFTRIAASVRRRLARPDRRGTPEARRTEVRVRAAGALDGPAIRSILNALIASAPAPRLPLHGRAQHPRPRAMVGLGHRPSPHGGADRLRPRGGHAHHGRRDRR
jgi:tetratricopeptide (TPR) repeat protein